MDKKIYEIHYQHNGQKQWCGVRASSEQDARKRFHFLTFDVVQIDHVKQVGMMDASMIRG